VDGPLSWFQKIVITEEQRAVIERLLLERISLRGIFRAIGVGLRWLLYFMTERFTAAPEHLYVQPSARTKRVLLQRLEAEVDELWSFVGRKANRQWVWIAMDPTTRQIIAFHVGDRSRQSAEALWRKLPTGYQEQAMFYTDCYEVYKGVIPPAQHRAITEMARQTNHGELSTARYGSGFLGWGVRRYCSQRNWLIISLSSPSFAMTTSPEVQLYQDSTTEPLIKPERELQRFHHSLVR